MKITPLAAESMGSRSMAVFVETHDCKILIDPGANIGQLRYGLAPHPIEQWCLQKHRERIHLFARSADYIVITHYHFDHFIPDAPELYKKKAVLLKNPNQKINVNQRNRAFSFIKKVQKLTTEIDYVDGRIIETGHTQITFSTPVSHGPTEKMGFVLQVAVHEGDQSFVFTSDVQGPCREDQLDFIISQNPIFLYLDGPVTYIQKQKSSKESLEKTLVRIERMIEKTPLVTLIIDHHLLRDIQWQEKIDPLFLFAQKRGVSIKTAAEFRGEENNLLEARRNQLYVSEPFDSSKHKV